MGANLRIESSASTYYPFMSFYNTFDYGSIIICGTTSAGGILVLNDGGTFSPVNASAFNVSSDKTLKKDISEITTNDYDNYLSQIRNIETITYRYNDEFASSSEQSSNIKIREYPHVGFAAQSLPDAIKVKMPTSSSVNPVMKLGYNLSDMAGLTLVGVKALDSKVSDIEKLVKEQQAEIELLKQEIKALKTK